MEITKQMDIPGIDGLKGLLEELQKTANSINKDAHSQMKEAIKLATQPQEVKNVRIDGLQCVSQLFPDRVVIIFPSSAAAAKFYKGKTKKKQLNYFQRFKKWLSK